jgi:hypothetical protein
MPTKTNKSPLHLDPLSLASMGANMADKALQDDDPTDKNSVGKAALGSGLKGAAMGAKIGTMIPIPGVGTALGAGVGFLAGSIIGGVKGQKAKEEGLAANTAEKTRSNISSAESIVAKNKAAMGIAMHGPLKMLTGVSSPMTYKMSAAQYNSALKMSVVSGASTLPSALTLKGNQYKIDANKDGKITGEDFKLLKNK